MLQDSFVDALINKNWIFRNIAESTTPQIPFKPVMTFFMADVNTLAIKNVIMTGLKGTWG